MAESSLHLSTPSLRDGVVVLRGVLDTAWLQHLNAALDEALAAPTPLAQNFAGTQGGAFCSDLYLSSAFAGFREFATRSPVGELGARMLGVDQVTLFTDELLVKEPGAPQETPWHHDMTYWPLGGDSVCSVWIPLDRVTRHVGALEFLDCGRSNRDPRLNCVEPTTTTTTTGGAQQALRCKCDVQLGRQRMESESCVEK